MATRSRSARRTVVRTRKGLWADAATGSWRWRTRTAWWCVCTIDRPSSTAHKLLWSLRAHD